MSDLLPLTTSAAVEQVIPCVDARYGTSYAWGCEGPATLALAINLLRHLGASVDDAVALHHSFAADFLERLPANAPLDLTALKTWLTKRRATRRE